MWTCPKCAEEIEDQFDSCWRCAVRPDETPPRLPTRPRFGDGILKAGCCVTIAAVAFWFPAFNPYLRSDPDPRIGPAVLLALLAITVTAFRTTDSLCCAYKGAPFPGRRKHLPWIAVTVLICWSPAALWAVIVVLGFVRSYAR